MPLGPSQEYLAKYNDFTLPGYVQREQFDSGMNIANHYAPYADGSLSEQVGLQNKKLLLGLKVWESDYNSCKAEVSRAATIVHSVRNGFAPLYVQKNDRYYEAMTERISVEKTAGQSVRTLEYEVQFECKPWLVSETEYTIGGVGTINTDQVSRTLSDGGWTPTRITVTGTNVTISGYTETGAFAGYVSIAGAVTNLVIDSDAFTAKIGSTNRNDVMQWADYRTFIGPGKTYFVTTGASVMTVKYNNRWYL